MESPRHTSNLSALGRRKGAWSPDEDSLLRKCIEKHGEGNWSQVPLKAGLKRCRRSCRLRWMNYLKPTIKRGDFAVDEIDLILRLHRLLGNRWALIAGRIPGRTANDIKNFWNTHLSKKHRLMLHAPSPHPNDSDGEKNIKGGNLRATLQEKRLKKNLGEEEDISQPTPKSLKGSIMKPQPTKNFTPLCHFPEMLTTNPTMATLDQRTLTSPQTSNDVDPWWKRILFEDGDDQLENREEDYYFSQQQLIDTEEKGREEEAINGGGREKDEQDWDSNLEAFWKMVSE